LAKASSYWFLGVGFFFLSFLFLLHSSPIKKKENGRDKQKMEKINKKLKNHKT
jgi:hypothetical protein